MSLVDQVQAPYPPGSDSVFNVYVHNKFLVDDIAASAVHAQLEDYPAGTTIYEVGEHDPDAIKAKSNWFVPGEQLKAGWAAAKAAASDGSLS